MKIIRITPNESGAYSPIQTGNFSSCPVGCAIIPDNMDLSEFYKCGGFVDITIENGVVTAMKGNPEAWAAWQAENPKTETQEQNEDESPVTWSELATAYNEGVNSIE